MASNRRMFSSDIVDSDAFLEMPQTSQNLYFHLGMRSDDDGFVDPKKIMRLVSATEDDLKILLAKRFVLQFESGVIVIKHWLIHNYIRADIYKETKYKKEKSTLGLNENNAYTELRDGVRPLKKVEIPPYLLKRNPALRERNNNVTTAYTQDRLEIGKKPSEFPKTGITPSLNQNTRPKSRFGGYSEDESFEEPAVDMETGETVTPAVEIRVKEPKSAIAEYNELIRWADDLRGFKIMPQTYLKQYAAFKLAKANKISREMLYQRFREYHEGKFSAPNGFDWTTVVYSFNRKR